MESQTVAKRRTSRKIALALAGVAVAVEAVALRRRGYGLGGNVVVQCRDGHMYTTIWVPGGSLKSLRFGWTRFQYCPVGKHWSLVTLVSVSELTDIEREIAAEHHDVRIP